MAYIHPPDNRACKWRDSAKALPPVPGWHPASIFRNARMLRYFDGKRWSPAVHSSSTVKEVERIMKGHPATNVGRVFWTDPWW
jgi:hypothetical protein